MGLLDTCVTILVHRRSALLNLAGIDTSNTSVEIKDAIGWAVTTLGVTPSDYMEVTDGEIVAAGGIAAVADTAEYRLLQIIKGNLARVDVTAGPLSEKWSQILEAIDNDLDRIWGRIREQYTTGTTIAPGSVMLDFMEKPGHD